MYIASYVCHGRDWGRLSGPSSQCTGDGNLSFCKQSGLGLEERDDKAKRISCSRIIVS